VHGWYGDLTWVRIVGREDALRAAGGSGTVVVAALFKFGIVFEEGGRSEGLSLSLWKCGLLRWGLPPRPGGVGGVGGLGDCAGDGAKCLGPDGFQLLRFAVCTAIFTSGDKEKFCELGFLSCKGGFLWSFLVLTFVHVSCVAIEALGCRMALQGFGGGDWLHVGQLQRPFP
jgi:hypothetical protein